MVELTELNRLLSLVKFNASLNCVEGLEIFRILLKKDTDGRVLRFLNRQLRKLEDRKRWGISYVIAEHYLQVGDLKNLRRLFAFEDEQIKESVLNALWGDPGSNPRMGSGIIELAIEGAHHDSSRVRTEACFVIQNQCGWGVDVSTAITSLKSLIEDHCPEVRHIAGYAVGNLAKRKYDMSPFLALLTQNLSHEAAFVRVSNAWALWQLSRHKHDIGSAVRGLVDLLVDNHDEDDQCKNAVGALLHHAKKSKMNAEQVKMHLEGKSFDQKRREIIRFQEEMKRIK